MIVFGTSVVKYAVVDTEDGVFRVFSDGNMDRWTDNEETHQSDYRWFDADKYDNAELDAIRHHGLTALGLV